MKRSRNILIALGGIFGIILAANAWINHTSININTPEPLPEEELMKAPKDALDSANIVLNEALKRHDAPATLAALIKGATAQILIDRDSLPAIIRRIETFANQSNNLVEQSLLRLYSAELYQQFLNNNYQIRQRAETNDFTLPIEAWSENMFNERIDTLLTQALAPERELKSTSVNRYAQALNMGSDTIFRPTLYDFVIAKSIDFYQRFSSQKESNDRILQLYSQALDAHANNKLSAPFMMWELQRFEYLSQDIFYFPPPTDNLKFYNLISELKVMLDRYQSIPYSVEIANSLVSRLRQTGTYVDAKQALDFCDRWIARYPNYERIALLQNQRNDLIDQSVSIRIPNLLYPQKSQTIRVNYRNTQSFTIHIYRQPDTLSLYAQNLYRPQKGEWSRENRVTTISSTLPHGKLSLISRQTTVEIPALAPGFYVAELSIDGKPNGEAINFSVSSVKTVVRQAGKGVIELLAVDALSGKPLSGATAKLYSNSSRYTQQKSKVLASYKTDKKGLCRIPIEEGAYPAIQVSYKGDCFAPATDLSYPYEQQDDEDVEPQTALFTDRSIYRPGQTILFTGIHYLNNRQMSRVIPSEKIKINLIDPSGNTLSSAEHTTDEYGQFNGSFVIPRNHLLGNYLIQVDNDYGNAANFSVEEYKLPMFKVEFQPVTTGGSFGKLLTISGTANSYTGVPQAGASVQYTIERRSNPFRWIHTPAQQIASGKATVDASGNFSISFIPQRDNRQNSIHQEQAYNFIIKASVTAPTGETVEQSTAIAIGDSPYFISVSAPEMIDKYQSTGKIKTEVRTLNGEVVKRACRLVFYSLYDRPQVEMLDSLKIKTQMAEIEVIADGSARYPDFSKWASGPYRIVAFSNDESGRTIQSQCNFILYSDKDKVPARYSPLWLPRTEWNAEVGETVKIPVGSSCEQAYLFYSIYSADRLLETRVLKLSNRCKTLNIKFDKKFNGIVTINFLIVKEGKLSTATVTIRPPMPKRELSITTTSFRDKLLPNQQESWTFSVTDPEGKPVVGRFMAEMFDASMQAIRHHDWDFNTTLPQPRCLVRTFPSTYSVFSRSLAVNDYQKAIPYPRETETTFIYANIGTRGYGNRLYFAMPTLSKSAVAENADALVTEEESTSYRESGFAQSTKEETDYRIGEVSTAFFYPTLTTDSLGQATLSFTVPNENAAWQFLALAYTQELFTGKYEAQTVSSKPIMVSPNLPRFVRQGDEVTLSTAVQNRTQHIQEGRVIFELFDPYTDSLLNTRKAAFLIEAGQSKTIDYRFTAPAGTSVVGFRVKADTRQHSDGEQQIIPVLPAKVLVTDSKPFFISGGENSTTVTLSGVEKKMKSEEVENFRMTLQYCNNPAWYAVQALPALGEPTGNDAISIMASLFANRVASHLATAHPRIVQAIESWKASGSKNLTSLLTQNEELKQVLLSATPWVLQATTETEQMQQLATLLDKNRAVRLAQEAFRQLKNLQTDAGGICWFSGMNPSFTVSLNILEGFSRMQWLGIPLDEGFSRMQNQLVKFIDQEIVTRWKRQEGKGLRNQPLTYDDICYLYVRSAYRDIPLAGETLEIHQAMMSKLKSWSRLNNLEKAYAALALHRYGFANEAQQVISSLRQYAITTPDKGMFWPNSRSSYSYRNGAVQEECALFHAFAEIDPVTTELDAIRQWLLAQKQTNQWGSTPATLDAISVLLYQGSDWLAADKGKTAITWGGKAMNVNPEESFVGMVEYNRTGAEITPTDAQAVIATNHAQPSWGALYWQYYDDVKNVESASVKELALHRQILVRQQSNEEATYIPLNTTSITTGDRIAVRLTLTVGQDMQFVCLTDARAACFEPVEQLSGYKYREGIGYYEEIGNTQTRFYFEFLPKGTYVITYEVNVDRSGEYTQGLSTIQSLYAPQIIARTPAQTVVVN